VTVAKLTATRLATMRRLRRRGDACPTVGLGTGPKAAIAPSEQPQRSRWPLLAHDSSIESKTVGGVSVSRPGRGGGSDGSNVTRLSTRRPSPGRSHCDCVARETASDCLQIADQLFPSACGPTDVAPQTAPSGPSSAAETEPSLRRRGRDAEGSEGKGGHNLVASAGHTCLALCPPSAHNSVLRQRVDGRRHGSPGDRA